ncbi:MAG: Multimodular transpeptidase-transglycosylase [Acidobacteriaceae bacterium]|nr:Multimodular transpeptidase-transglycosylase [Acidobacteriaceae bacterium]
MALTLKIARPRGTVRPLWETVLAIVAIVFTFVLLILGITFSYYSAKYKQVVDERLKGPVFTQTPRIYAAPREVRTGQKLTAESIGLQLRSAGYSAPGRHESRMGTYEERGETIVVHPGPESYHSEEGATIRFSNGRVSAISGDAGQQLGAYELEPQLITSLSEGANRARRRLVTYEELPPALVQAVTSIEDHRFFSHGGVDYYSLLGWAYHDAVGDRRYRGGASTLTMQLARGLFLSPARKLKRKLIEIAITFQLEQRFTKQQIFEMYANQVPLGQQGSFGIYGFGEAAHAYFGKDVRQLDLAECALLAGMIQQPSSLNPYRHAKRAISRRNVVLGAMVDTHDITEAQAQAAKQEPLRLAPGTIDGGLAPYFIDIVHDQLVRSYGEAQYSSQGLRVYTSLDPDLQSVANEAVAEGMKTVDALVERRRVKAKNPDAVATPQVALVALNPHTGQILALVGGRNYGISQLNHAVAHRPTGSIFKPFVYAAGFNTSLAGTQLTTPTAQTVADNPNADSGMVGEPQQTGGTPAPTDPGLRHGIFTEVTLLNNDPTTFEGGYAPRNYGHHGLGEVTARYALQYSLNNATVELAQMVGYNNVAALARDAGIKSAQGTPAVALGAYDATPIDMAGAYTTFANSGTRIVPWEIASVRASNGDPISDHQPDEKPILDPRVAYLTTNMLQNVMNAGTAAGARARGFMAPAAAKTGTSHDAWYAGYTSNLICIIWVGNDDYSDIKLEGAQAAAPIWAEFMKHAVELPQYSDTRDFSIPQGVNLVKLDKNTNLLADPTCPQNYYAAFLDGTAPTNTCSHPNDDGRNFFQKLFGLGGDRQQQLPPTAQPTVLPPGQPQPANAPGMQNAQNGQPGEQPKQKKRGFFGRLFGGGKKDDQQQQQQQQPNQQ